MDIERLETRDMRDELDSLRAENAGLREKHQWISVKDRMPEPNTEVLIFIPDGKKDLSALMKSTSAIGWPLQTKT